MGRVYLVPVKILYDAKGVQRTGLRVASVYIEFIQEPAVLPLTKQASKLFGSKASTACLTWNAVKKPKTGIKYACLESIQDYTWEQLDMKVCRLRTVYGEKQATLLLGTALEKVKYNICDIKPTILTGGDIEYTDIANMTETEYNRTVGHIYLLNNDGAFLELAPQPYDQRMKRWSRKMAVSLKVADSKVATSATSSTTWIASLAHDLEAQALLFAYSKGKQLMTKKWCVPMTYAQKFNDLPLHCIQYDALQKDIQLNALVSDAVGSYDSYFCATYQVDLEKFETLPKMLLVPKNIESYRVYGKASNIKRTLPKILIQEPIKNVEIRGCSIVSASACSQGFSVYRVDTTDSENGTYIADAPLSFNTDLANAAYKVVTQTFVPPAEPWILPDLFTAETRDILDIFELIIVNPLTTPAMLLPMASTELLLSISSKAPALMLGFDTRVIKKAKRVRISLLAAPNGMIVVNLQGAHIGQLYIDISIEPEFIAQGMDIIKNLHVMNGSITTLNITTNVIIQQVQIDGACKKIDLIGKTRNVHTHANYSQARAWVSQTDGLTKGNAQNLQLKRAAVITLTRMPAINVLAETAPKEISATADTKCNITVKNGVAPEISPLHTPYYDF